MSIGILAKDRVVINVEASNSLREALLHPGVTSSSASATMARYPVERIKAQLEVFDWLMAHKAQKCRVIYPAF